LKARSALRLVAAVVLLALSLWWAGPADVWRAASRARWDWIAAALLLVVFDRALNAYRWIALLDPVMGTHRPPLRAILRVFFVSSFLGTFLPGSVGGDAVRTLALNRLNVPAADAFASVFLDRFLGILSNLVMALAGLVLARELAQDPAVRTGLLGTAAICVVAAALIFSRNAARASTGLARRLPGERAGRITEVAVAGLQRYTGHWGVLATVLAASIGVQVLRVFQSYCLGRSLGIDLGPSAYFAFIPPILIVVLLPLSASGIGTSQIAFIALFSRAGVDEADAVALSILFLALGAVGNLPGGILYAMKPRAVPET
jgi:glycosyltransferase 2 family protein